MGTDFSAFKLLDRWMALSPEDREKVDKLALELYRNAAPEAQREAMRILREATDERKEEAA